MKQFRFRPPLTGVIAGFGSLFGHKGVKDDGEKFVIDTDKDGNELFKEDIIAKVMDELTRRKTEKTLLEQQWILNANFLIGNQFCEINTYRGDIEQLEPVYDWLEREVFNQISPLIETRVANLKKINYMMKVKPATNELSDYAKADIATSILQHTQQVSDFETKKNTMIYWNELCGNCFWLSWWNKDGGELYAIEKVTTVDDEGNQKVEEKGYFEGDIDYGLLTPYEVYPESIFQQGVEAQRSIILEQVKSVDEIYDLYEIEVEGTNVETFQLTPAPTAGGLGYEKTVMTIGHRTMDNAQKVVTYMERPSKRHPNGKLIIIVGEDNLVFYGDLPYRKIPIVQCVCRETAGQFFGRSVIEDLIPRQRALNGCINRIHEYIKRVAIGSYMTEEGSVDIEEYTENGQAPGALLVYRQGSNPPVPIPNGVLPSEIMTERYNLKSDMEYAAGVSQLMVNGATPSGITSGTAISNLMEIDNTRLSLTGDHIRNSVRKLAILWLEIYKSNVSTKRVINYVGSNNIGKALVWSRDDINSYDVQYLTENELLMSEDMQKQNFLNAYNMGLFTDEKGVIPERFKLLALEKMKIGNYSDIMSINLLQIQAAQRENSFFESGVIPEISEFDDHNIHIEEHLRYILQMDFRLLKLRKPEYAKALENHINQHKQAVIQAAQQNAMMAGQMMSGQVIPGQKGI